LSAFHAGPQTGIESSTKRKQKGPAPGEALNLQMELTAIEATNPSLSIFKRCF